MDIIISNGSNKPIYEQIVDQIKEMVMNGELHNGELIPPMRSLAKSLRVSTITVQHAYEILQRDGYIKTNVGRGSYVSVPDIAFIQDENLKKIEELLNEVIEIGKKNGITAEKIRDILFDLYEEKK